MDYPISIKDFLLSKHVEKPFATVIGSPIGHSLSPLIHNHALESCGLFDIYFPVEVHSFDSEEVKALFTHSNFRGSNVTIPHKRAVIDLLDSVSDTVNETGACNTVVPTPDGLYGENTDVPGFMQPLLPFKRELTEKDAIVFGSGGASAAIVYALHKAGIRHTYIVSRSADGSTQSSSDGTHTVVSYDSWPDVAKNAAIFVNATPLGMHPKTDASPISMKFEYLLRDKICYDIVYKPRNTRFLQQGASQNARCIDGIDMFIGQAAIAFKLFFGHDFPVNSAKNILIEALKS